MSRAHSVRTECNRKQTYWVAVYLYCYWEAAVSPMLHGYLMSPAGCVVFGSWTLNDDDNDNDDAILYYLKSSENNNLEEKL